MALEERNEFGKASQMITADDDFSFQRPKELLRVNIACGQVKDEGWIGIDSIKTDKVDIVHDLFEFPWPLDDGSVYEFRCSHFVEHIPIQLKDGSFGLHRFMEEVYRCLAPGGSIQIVAPYYTSIRAWQDPTHTRAITDVTFSYYSKKILEGMNVDHYAAKCNFSLINRTFLYEPEYEAYSHEAREYARKHYFNVVMDMMVTLRKEDL